LYFCFLSFKPGYVCGREKGGGRVEAGWGWPEGPFVKLLPTGKSAKNLQLHRTLDFFKHLWKKWKPDFFVK
jgi:hypothetical protein